MKSKALLLLMAGLMLATMAFANDMKLVVTGDAYITPNDGNNYEDAWGISAGVEHPLYKNLKGIASVSHMTDINFPSVDDPKGNWGELRGYGAMYDLKFELPYNENVIFFAKGGGGAFIWDFKENPFLQDNNVEVDVDPSLAFRAGAGVEVKLKDGWDATVEGGWFDTDIPKDARDSNGLEWNILDDDAIGLQYIYVKAGIRYRF